ncbi:MAG: lysine--tRNA ligase [Nanoarchaeota archaeon]
MTEETKELFWADQLAKEILSRKTFHYIDREVPKQDEYTVKTSASISGVLHIGRLSDTIRGSSVVKALRDAKANVRFIWVAEDMDPLRKVPQGVPDSFAEYIGMPVTDIPDPDGCHSSYAAHHVAEYFKVIDDFVHGELEKFSMREEYKKGSFNPFIKKILENVGTVIEIQNRYRSNPLAAGWSPWTPICKECRKISTPRIISIKNGKVEYECKDYNFETTIAKGCGYNGENDPMKDEGKLMWKSEWAAQWSRWKVSSEGAGKEYQVPNSAFWINGEIVEKVLDWPMPKPIFYEHLFVDDVKMSASLGNVVYPKDWLQVASPQLLRFLYNKRLMKTRSLSWKELSQLYDEYDHAGKVAFEMATEENEKEKAQLKRLHEMSNFERSEEPLEMSFSYACVLVQTYEDDSEAIRAALKKTGHYQPMLDEKIFERIEKAKAWLSLYAPQDVKFSVQKSVSASLKLTEKEIKALKLLAEKLREKQFTEKELSMEFYETAKAVGITAKELYKAGYLVLLNQEKGPRLANFLLVLGDRAIKLFESL